jgi:hypothetical protein
MAANGIHHARRLVSQHDRNGAWEGAVDHAEIRVADSAVGDPNANLARSRLANLDIFANP